MPRSRLCPLAALVALCSFPAAAQELSFVEAEIVPAAPPSACTDVGLPDVAVRPDGAYVYVLYDVCIGNDQLLTYAAADDGSLTFVDEYPIDSNPNVLEMAPDGSALFYGTNNGGIGAMLLDAVTGLPTFADQENDGVGVSYTQFTYGIAASPDGRNLYATGGENAVTTFDWDAVAHTLTPSDVDVSGENGLVLSAPAAIVVTPDGDFVAVASSLDKHLVVFDRNPTTGAISRSADFYDDQGGVYGLDAPGALAAAPTTTSALASLYVTSLDTTNLVHFDQGPAASPPAFSFVEAQDVGTLPMDVVVRGGGARLYVSDSALHRVTAIARDTATGALGAAVDSMTDGVAGANGLNGVTRIAAQGRHLYALSSSEDAIAVIDVPEPAGMALGVAVGIALAARRRRSAG